MARSTSRKKTTKTTSKKAKSNKQPGRKRASKSAVVEEWSTEAGGVRSQVKMTDEVVATIAGITAQKVSGIHSLGKSSLIAFGGSKPTRGVDVEVGQKEVALDLEVVIEHGCDIRETIAELRERIVSDVDQMTGRKVVELNLDIVGIELPQPDEPEPEPEPEPQTRVR